MTKKVSTTEQEEPKHCMTYTKSIKTANYEIFKGKKAKLTQSDIEKMHDEIKVKYPNINDWIVNTPK